MFRNLEDIADNGKETLSLNEVAPVLGVCAQTLRTAAHNAPEKLGFPVVVANRRVVVPKQAFISFMKGERNDY